MRNSTTLGLLAGAAALFALGCATSSQEVTKAGDFQEGGVGRPIATKPAPGLDTVYFDYDRAEIRNDARGKLQGNASVIEDKKWERVVLGDVDEGRIDLLVACVAHCPLQPSSFARPK